MVSDKSIIQSLQNKVVKKIQPLEEPKKVEIYKCAVAYEGKRVVALALEKLNLKEVPDEIEKLSDLRYLSLSNNEIENVPPWVGKLKKLKKLIFSGNKIKNLPSNLGKSKSLEVFHILKNPIDRLPISFRRYADIYSQFREIGIKQYGLERKTRETVDMLKNRGVRVIEPERS